jgi:hypothetical protein
MLADINRHLDSDSTAVCDVEVQDESGTAGMGKAAAAALAKAGFKVTEVDTAPDGEREHTRVRYLSGNQSLASSAVAALGAGKPESASSAEAAAMGQVPLQVVVGSDYEVVAQPVTNRPVRATTPAKEE